MAPGITSEVDTPLSKECPAFMELEVSLWCSKIPSLAHNLTSYIFKIHFHIILPFVSRSYQ